MWSSRVSSRTRNGKGGRRAGRREREGWKRRTGTSRGANGAQTTQSQSETPTRRAPSPIRQVPRGSRPPSAPLGRLTAPYIALAAQPPAPSWPQSSLPALLQQRAIDSHLAIDTVISYILLILHASCSRLLLYQRVSPTACHHLPIAKPAGYHSCPKSRALIYRTGKYLSADTA